MISAAYSKISDIAAFIQTKYKILTFCSLGSGTSKQTNQPYQYINFRCNTSEEANTLQNGGPLIVGAFTITPWVPKNDTITRTFNTSKKPNHQRPKDAAVIEDDRLLTRMAAMENWMENCNSRLDKVKSNLSTLTDTVSSISTEVLDIKSMLFSLCNHFQVPLHTSLHPQHQPLQPPLKPQ
ncbi:rsmA [Acrasis kona]|uniref:RsmA n=1 Tax=Acrasis kona TaxID=1008807 RepID=A0AAW2YNN6_9EUKA